MLATTDYVPYLGHKIQAGDLDALQRQALMRLNEILAKTEKNIKKEALSLMVDYQRKVDDEAEWIADYEADVDISFWLKESDPAFDEDQDNILVVLNEPLKHCHEGDIEYYLGGNVNHNEFQHWPDHPMKDEFHCWLYHCLYDHTELGWIDILRIGSIWVEIKCDLQNFIELDETV